MLLLWSRGRLVVTVKVMIFGFRAKDVSRWTPLENTKNIGTFVIILAATAS
jgi:hypothetical protein